MTLAVNLVSVEYEMRQCSSMDDQELFQHPQQQKLPVLLLYGTTVPSVKHPRSQKCLVHVHQVYPYLYVEAPADVDDLHAYADSLHLSISHALKIHGNQQQYEQVHSVVAVRGISVYGFHGRMQPFFKVSLLNPRMISVLVQLMSDGAIMGREMQAYESHISYDLQFMMDYNLYGMAVVHFQLPLQARGAVDEREMPDIEHNLPGVTMEWLLQQGVTHSTQPKQSHCEWELDCQPWSITNRMEVEERLDEPFKPQLDSKQKLVHSLKTMAAEVGAGTALDDEDGSIRLPRDATEVELAVKERIQQLMTTTPYEVAGNDPAVDALPTAQQSTTMWWPQEFRDADDNDILPAALTQRVASLPASLQSRRESIQGTIIVDERMVQSQIMPTDMQLKVDQSSDTDDFGLDADEFVDDAYKEEEVDDQQEMLDVLQWMADKPPTQSQPAAEHAEDEDFSDVDNAAFNDSLDGMWSPISVTGSDEQPSVTPTQSRVVVADSQPQWHRCTDVPPCGTDVQAEIMGGKITVQYRDPFFSDIEDLLSEPRGKPPQLLALQSHVTVQEHTRQQAENSWYWIPILMPPTRADVEAELHAEQPDKPSQVKQVVNPEVSQLDAPSRSMDFKFDQGTQEEVDVNAVLDLDTLTLLSVEIFAATSDNRLPDPEKDAISFFAYAIEDASYRRTHGEACQYFTGLVIVRDDSLKLMSLSSCDAMFTVDSELDLIECLCTLVQKVDPDIIMGFELHMQSLGYAIERAALHYQLDLAAHLSRPVVWKQSQPRDPRANEWAYQKTSGVELKGRVVLNVWRLLKAEVNVTSYTYQNFMYHVLHQRVPKFTYWSLSKWYFGRQGLDRHITARFMLDMTVNNLVMLDACNIVGRTQEFARVYGTLFASVISRGSQFKVESMLLRIAKPENFMMISPTRLQVRNMRALECVPLVMEPETAFYKGPMLVLDFQSLYPSIMIAFNYCYSTCLGKFHPQMLDTLGFATFSVNWGHVKCRVEDINISPNGVAFLKPHIRSGLLRKMLSEILDTRVATKNFMKTCRDSKSMTRKLDSRQLGLKLIANVTYGYTSASFSGRMPCVEVSDSIVQTARDTLERAIVHINAKQEWGARVVYGDTDSCFVYLEGATRERAFVVGRQIAEEITTMNPHPMKLKFEKVYHPAVLLTKKHYVGYKYEYEDQAEPQFDAKGIETVRRDGCPAVSKMVESTLKILFRSQDMSELKQYLQLQWLKIIGGRIPLQDFIIAKAVKLGTYSENGIGPAGAVISLAKMEKDKRAEPQYGERVPYVVKYSGPKARLVDCVISPDEFVADDSSRLNHEYYITKQIIPPLQRIIHLVGIDLMKWYHELPRTNKAIRYDPSALVSFSSSESRTIDFYYRATNCLSCGKSGRDVMCDDCMQEPDVTAMQVSLDTNAAEFKHLSLMAICRTCTRSSLATASACVSVDCPVFFERVKSSRSVKQQQAHLPQALELLQ